MSTPRTALLFDAHDAAALALPGWCLDRRATLDRLRAALEDVEQPVDVADVEDTLVSTVFEQATTGDVTVDPVAALADAARAHDQHQVRTRIIRAAIARAERDVDGVVGRADELVVGVLRPALGEVVEAVRKAAQVLGPGTTAEQIVYAAAGPRKAWESVQAAGRRYRVIRQVQSDLARAAEQPLLDVDGEFEIAENLTAVWPEWLRRRSMIGGNLVPPWPTDDAGQFLLWCQHNKLELVCLTAAERDERFRKAHAEELAALDRQRELNHAVHAGGGAWVAA